MRYMTKYEKLLAGGPELMAWTLSESKIRAMEKITAQLGIDFKVNDIHRSDSYKEHYEFLMTEE